MAELLGAVASGVTLAALFKACIEAFDLIQTSRHQELDLKKLKLRLNIEKCRLYVWGESMGLTDTAEEGQSRPIDRFRFPEVVRETLEVVFQLFHDSHKIRDKYGCRQATSDDLLLDINQNGPLNSLAASFSNFSIRCSQFSRTSKTVQNIVWVIHDHKKFSGLVVEIKDLVGSLQGITSPSVPVNKQSGIMKRKIAKISDVETLSLIVEVCCEDHPDIAGAASTKADTLSLASTPQHHVATWTESVRDAQMGAEERMSPDLESLTITELKHKYLEVIRKQKERETSSLSQSVPESLTVASPFGHLATSPSALGSGTKCSNIDPPSAVSQATDQVSLQDNPTGLASTHENMGFQYPSGVPQFTNPWAKITSVAEVYPLRALPYSDVTFGELDASRGTLAHPHPGSHDMTRRNIYEAGPQRPLADNYGYPHPSSVSSYSAFSNHGNPHYAGSVSGSVDDPTDYSSATSDASYDFGRYRTLPRPSQLVGRGETLIAPQPMMSQFSSKMSSSREKKHKCKVCDKRFMRPSSLQTHMYSHTGEKPFACSFEGCGRHFSVVSNLRRHRKVHKDKSRENPSDPDSEMDTG